MLVSSDLDSPLLCGAVSAYSVFFALALLEDVNAPLLTDMHFKA